MNEWMGLLLGAGGFGTLLVLAVKRTWSDRDAVNTAHAAGRAEARSESFVEIEQLRREFTERHGLLSAHVDRLHNAVIDLVELVPAENMPKALTILAKLGALAPDIPLKEHDS